jgi:diguanylate cyclase (GGDEF)-like protein
MHLGPGLRVRERLRAVPAWPVWQHQRWLVAYILAVTGGYIVAIGLTGMLAPVPAHDLLLFGGLLLCSAVTVELTRRAGENTGFISHIFGVWELPVAILLSPVLALLVPLPRVMLAQLRVRKLPLHRRVFSVAVIGLSLGAASLVFHALGHGLGLAHEPALRGPWWVLAVAAAAVVQLAVNLALVLPAIKGSDPAVRLRDTVMTREVAQNDLAELCVAVLVTSAIAVSPLAIVFALPFVTLLQRSLRHGQLVAASRIDSKTGLLNAGTWEREAGAEVARAVRTRTPLALALVDIDHFKAVNDAYGHLAGDKALNAIARTFRIFLREYDLVGRFGGEEFAVLLPHTKAVDAYGIAERIREHLAHTPLDVADSPGQEPVRVTVSMGVAALGSNWSTRTGSQLTDLLAAADRALYQAKRAGRNQVCVITDSAVVTAPSQVSQLGRA